MAANERHVPRRRGGAATAHGTRRVGLSPAYAHWLHGTVATLLARGVARGQIAPLDIDPAADLVLAPLAIDLYLHQRQRRGYSADRILATVRHILFDGLRAPRS